MFESARLKIKRANHHIGDLKGTFTRMIEDSHGSFIIRDNPETGNLVEVRFGETILTDLALMAGDAVHNLRTALDHATWELIGIDGGTQDKSTAFQTSANDRDYEAACNGIKTPRSDTKKFFISLAAFPGGAGEKFYHLHHLDISDKHKVVTPVIGIATVDHLKLMNPDGQVMVEVKNCSFRMGPDGSAGLVGGFGPLASVRVDQDAKATLRVLFGEVEFFQGLPLIKTLMELSDAVEVCMGQFEEFVVSRE